jgi:hypothetical protein
MNSLSWLLYWAAVLPNVATFIGLIAFLLSLLSAVALAFHFIVGDETRENWHYDDERRRNDSIFKYTDEARTAQKLWWTKISLPIFILLWASSFLVPEKETFYMIAASQAGEKALEAPEVGKIRAVINNWLDEHGATKVEDKK